MMFFLDNKEITPAVKKEIDDIFRNLKGADFAAVTMQIEGRAYVFSASFLLNLKRPRHCYAVQKKIDEQQNKENPNG